MKPNNIVRSIIRKYCENNQAECGRRIGITRALMYAIVHGRCKIAPKYAFALERLCDGEYRAEQMNPECASLRRTIQGLS